MPGTLCRDIRALLYQKRGRPLRVVLTNISAHGFRVDGDDVADVGDVVWLQIAGGPQVKAFVAWTHARCAGCEFALPTDPGIWELARRHVTSVDRQNL